MATLPFFGTQEYAAPQSPANQHTVGALIHYYMTEVLPTKARGTVTQQTFLMRRFTQEWGHLPLDALTPALLRAWRDTLLQGDLTPGTVRYYMSTLSAALTVAIKELGWLTDQPMRRVRKPPETPGRTRFLNDTDRQRLLQACQTSRNWYLYPIVLLTLSTGGRRSEILQLRWEDVDVERGYVQFLRTKNNTPRTVAVTGPALEILRTMAQTRQAGIPWVFPNSTCTKGRHVRHAWAGAVERAGITDLHFHDLRHSCASYLAMHGASLLEIAEVLGHKQLRMVQRYVHFLPSHTTTVMERITSKIFGELAPGDEPAAELPPVLPAPERRRAKNGRM